MEKEVEKTSSEILSCIICLTSPATDPVVTQCGHIFCWECIKNWVNKCNKMFCPTCKNGIDIEKVISLYSGSSKSTDKPKNQRIEAKANPNRPGFFSTIYNTFIGNNSGGEEVIQYTQNEIKANQMALGLFFFIVFIIILIIYG